MPRRERKPSAGCLPAAGRRAYFKWLRWAFGACALACSDPDRTNVVPGGGTLDTWDASYPEPDIDPPSLPECLMGDEPTGCASKPALPPCLSGAQPNGCAEAPILPPWDCPDGWLSAEDADAPAGFSFCVPNNTTSCADGQAAFLPHSTCAPIGTACPSQWLDEDTIRALAPGFDGDVKYVAPGGSGHGTLTDPFGSVSSAIADAATGDIVALSVGVFPGHVTIDRRIALVGSCVSATSIDGDDIDENSGVIEVAAEQAQVSNLRLSSEGVGVWVRAGSSGLRLWNAEVLETVRQGVRLEAGADHDLRDLAVRRIRPRPSDNALGEGVLVAGGSSRFARGIVEDCVTFGVRVMGHGSVLDAEDLIIRNTQPGADLGEAGVGLFVIDSAEASLQRALLERNHAVGIEVAEAGTVVSLADVVVRDTQVAPVGDSLLGIGLRVYFGAEATASRVVLDRSHEMGLYVSEQNTHFDGSDLVIRESRAVPGQDDTSAVVVMGEAIAEMRRVVALRNERVGIGLSLEKSELRIDDVFIGGTTAGHATGLFGCGIQSGAGTRLTVRRAWLHDNGFRGLVTEGVGAELTASDIRVSGTRIEEATGKPAVGVHITNDASGVVERVTATGSEGIGIGASHGGSAVFREVLVADTLPESDGLAFGAGVVAIEGGQLEMERAAIRRNQVMGMFAEDEGSTLIVSDTLVEDGQPRAFDGVGGIGVQVFNGARAELERVELRRNQLLALGILGVGTTMSATDLSIVDTQPEEGRGTFGEAIMVSEGGAFDGLSVSLRGNHRAGVLADGEGTTVRLRELLLSDMHSDRIDLLAGYGVVAQAGAFVELAVTRIDAARESGVIAVGAGTAVVIGDMVASRNLMAECAEETAPPLLSCAWQGYRGGGGKGVTVSGGAHVSIERFDVSFSEMVALQLGMGGGLAMGHGVVHDNVIGLNVQDPAIDLSALLVPTVRFRDNVTNLDAARLPLPDPLEVAPAVDPDFDTEE